jgi:hypothetical protein
MERTSRQRTSTSTSTSIGTGGSRSDRNERPTHNGPPNNRATGASHSGPKISPYISDDEIERVAKHALQEGMERGVNEGTRANTSFVAPLSCTQRWANAGWRAAKCIVPLSFAAGVMYMTAEPDRAWTTVGLAGGATASMIYQAYTARFGRDNFKDGLRVGFIQLTSQFASAMTIKFGLEQAANAADPTLSMTGHFNGTHWDADPTNLIGNVSDAYYIDHERLFPGGTAWNSMAIVGVPATLQFVSFLWQPRAIPTGWDGFLHRLRFDGRGDPATGALVRARWSDRTDTLVRNISKATILAMGVGLAGALFAAGHRKLALRILSNANLVMSAARCRDFMNMAKRGISPGAPSAERWPDGGWARQQQITIPATVLEVLKEDCTDPGTGEIDEIKLERAVHLLKVWYRNLFIGGRVSSMPIYTGAGAFGLFIMRDMFSPPVGSVFADTVYEALSVAVPFSLGTAFTEAIEEPGWAFMVSVWAGSWGMPFNIARTPAEPEQKFRENLAQLSFTTLLPGQNIIRAVWPSRYTMSSVGSDGAVALSLDARLDLNAGIRAGQNLATMILLTSAGASTDSETKLALYMLGVTINGLTHFRGNVVEQILISGYEGYLHYLADPVLNDSDGYDADGHASDDDLETIVVSSDQPVDRQSSSPLVIIPSENERTSDGETERNGGLDSSAVVANLPNLPDLPLRPTTPSIENQLLDTLLPPLPDLPPGPGIDPQ